MATATVTYTFTNGQSADALQVNANFSDILTFINNSLVQTDGSTVLANNAVTTAKINDGAVTSAKIADGNVTVAKIAAEAWTAWTPTVKQSSTTLTNSSNNSYYYQIGKTVIASFDVYANKTTAPGNAPITVSLPVVGKTGRPIYGSGYVIINDSANNYYYNAVTWGGSGSATTLVTALRGDRQETYISPTTTNPLWSFNAAYSASSRFLGTVVYEAA